ncbi:uncharacterized protein LOC128742285 [Sabethes cyaneus]|uniref:uncharacterized protein LOC128742285 n=1 Tax=Sabethes cyaneus TaxID=53552 RepID=UPI00237DEF81|nr:uncharacterized protein LOC128742285 [Sabethes cyaneus]XP_053694584.1 uncharacterized protein LOC128742285 [Sabethes cyaneus]
MRPSTLNLRQQNHDVSRDFLREAYRAWNERSDDCVVPGNDIKLLFNTLNLFPSTEQVHDMLQTAKLVLQTCNNCASIATPKTGLKFGEFLVLLSDIRKLRHTSILNNHDISQPVSSEAVKHTSLSKKFDEPATEAAAGPEVFLGGSCNPTTWRADVAIPTLDRLGISFYNPQVSQWTPDLLELEHRAKEKAKVLFFVMDSQTRSTAGAIEVAHIAGRNSKHLVLVLLPYKQNQKILDETLTIDEYMDLSRNQLLLKQLVRRKGLPVLDNIPLALEYIKNILSGKSCRRHPQNIATRLISVRRTFDRVVENSNFAITLTQCQKALVTLGYPSGIASITAIKQIMAYFGQIKRDNKPNASSSSSCITISNVGNGATDETMSITFEGLCILDSYFSVLHQEILETSCVSPIKGTNLQQPPIYLSNSPEWHHRIPSSPHASTSFVIEDAVLRNCLSTTPKSNLSDTTFNRKYEINVSHHINDSTDSEYTNNAEYCRRYDQKEESLQNTQQRVDDKISISSKTSESNMQSSFKIRDIYLGGSCWMLTNWRQKYAFPYLRSKNVTFYTSSFYEGFETAANMENILNEEEENENESMFNPALLDLSRVLLFVITNDTRSLGAMTMAAHYIGMGYNVIMCVQMLSNGCVLRGTQLSNSAVKDYNRGRTYLIDLAKRQGIPVFNEIQEALDCAVEKLRVY